MARYIRSYTATAFAVLACTVYPAGIAGAVNAFDLPEGSVTTYRIDYSGSLSILPIGKLVIRGELSRDSYTMRADMRTSGLGKLNKSSGLVSNSLGMYGPDGIKPTEHIIQKNDKKNRRTEIAYNAESAPDVSIVPPRGSMGVPPATDEEKRDATDALSGILKLMMTGHSFEDRPCTGIIPIFDGKQRYNLRLEAAGVKNIRQKSYSGEVLRCHVYMETVSGYDPEDLLSEEEASTPLEAYLANYDEAGLWIPVKFEYRISGVTVNIQANKISVQSGH